MSGDGRLRGGEVSGRRLGRLGRVSVWKDPVGEPHSPLLPCQDGCGWRHTKSRSERGNGFEITEACVRLRKELRAFQFLVVPSFPACLRTPTGTMTVGGGELSAPEAWACCRGGMVEQYSAGLLGFGLWLLVKTGVSHD